MKDVEAGTQQPNLYQVSEGIANTLWRMTETWSEYAKVTMATPLMRALDSIGLQLAHTRGRTTVKQHLQHVSNARKTLVSADYYLRRAIQRGLIEPSLGEQMHVQLLNLAQRIDQHSQAIVKAANQKISEQEQQKGKKTKTVKKDEKIKTDTTDTVSTH